MLIHSALFRIAIGFIIMAVVCVPASRAGDASVRLVAIMVASAWVLVTAAQLTTGLIAEPAIVGDFVVAIPLLWLAWRRHLGWVWAMIAVEACLFGLHAWFYEAGRRSGLAYALASDGLSVLALIMLEWAAARHRSGAAQPDVTRAVR